MRKLAIVLLFLLAGTVLLYSEEYAEEEAVSNDSEQPVSSVVPSGSQLILYNAFYSVLNPKAFSFADGSALSYSRLKENLALVPENAKFIRGADIWNVLNYVSIGAAVACAAAGAVYGVIDYDSRPSARVTGIYVGGIGAGLFSAGTSWMIVLNLDKAVHNYNLSVMGLPVRYR